MKLWVEMGGGLSAGRRGNGKEKECDPVCNQEQNQQDRLGRHPGKDDFRWEDSDPNSTKVVIT